MEEAGQQLAAREIAERAEEHDHVVLGHGGTIGAGHAFSMALARVANSTPKIIVDPAQPE
jgi:hypothetical protein